MTNYEVTSSNIEASLKYLEKIYSYLIQRQYSAGGIEPVLIGGWAVHAYNPWFGSLDIDLISNNKVTSSLKQFLKKDGFMWNQSHILKCHSMKRCPCYLWSIFSTEVQSCFVS